MGLSGVSVSSLLLIFAIVVLLFGTKRLRTIGDDVGAALRSFRKGMKEADAAGDAEEKAQLRKDETETH